VILDTNILIAYLSGQKIVIETVQSWKSRGPLFISSITTLELLALAELAPKDIQRIKLFLQNFISVPLDNNLSEIGALFKRTYGLELPDAAIAATAAVKNLTLVTRDKQFRKVREITTLKI